MNPSEVESGGFFEYSYESMIYYGQL